MEIKIPLPLSAIKKLTMFNIKHNKAYKQIEPDFDANIYKKFETLEDTVNYLHTISTNSQFIETLSFSKQFILSKNEVLAYYMVKNSDYFYNEKGRPHNKFLYIILDELEKSDQKHFKVAFYYYLTSIMSFITHTNSIVSNDDSKILDVIKLINKVPEEKLEEFSKILNKPALILANDYKTNLLDYINGDMSFEAIMEIAESRTFKKQNPMFDDAYGRQKTNKNRL